MTRRKKYPKIIHSIIKLTPEIAQKLLNTQTKDQRTISKTYVNTYAQAVKKGLWQFAGDPIRVDWYGKLIDGQHRYQMVIQSEKSIKILILYGLDPNVFKVIDSGKKRAVSDALTINGEKSCKLLAAALVLLYYYLRDGKKRISTHRGAATGKGGPNEANLQTEEILNLLEKQPDIRKSLAKVYSTGKLLPASGAVFCHYLFSKIDPEMADTFFEKLSTGEDLKKGNPILALRNTFLLNKLEVKEMPRGIKIGLTIKAWNMCRKEKTCTKISWKTKIITNGKGEKKRVAEPIPEII